jgi:hypothetical protein
MPVVSFQTFEQAICADSFSPGAKRRSPYRATPRRRLSGMQKSQNAIPEVLQMIPSLHRFNADGLRLTTLHVLV